MSEKRDWDDPQYKEWRMKVYKRDKFICQMPGCGKKGFKNKLQAHHIKRWADFPELRFVVENGITLCRNCHDKISKLEDAYAGLFTEILNQGKNKKKNQDTFFSVKKLLYTETEDEE